jgi:site-specific DNA recombinase
MRVGIYCRISEDREGAGLGVEPQRKGCQIMAEARGWQVLRVYDDNDCIARFLRERSANTENKNRSFPDA